MKAYMTLVTIGCFMFSMFAGASIHTLVEVERQRAITISLINMPLHDLAKYDI